MSIFTNISKNTATFLNTAKSVVFNPSFLIKQDGGYLLLQTGGKIKLSQSGGYPNYSNQPKS